MQNNVTPRSFGSANGLPWIKAATYRGIMMLAADIGGPIDFSPEQRFPGAQHAVLLEGANLLIVGTRTGPNIGLYDVSAVARQYGMDLLLARFSGPVAKYDIYRCKDDQWFTGYQRAWFEDRYWFCPPDEVDQPFILAHRRGLQFSTHAPCPDARRFEAGAKPNRSLPRPISQRCCPASRWILPMTAASNISATSTNRMYIVPE